MKVKKARKRRICRICKDKDSPKRLDNGEIDPFVLNYGKEYAHQSCLDKEHGRS